ncbi:MAG: 4a-hydroxytetrahydrobiopterin dehydratase [Phycisphaerae bacterium]|nr:4a-hydroxytetrahydrobiopterin dehydratase [Phycisphaerae bacterium]
MVEKISEQVLDDALVELVEWSRSGESLQRTFAFGGFKAAIEFVGRVAERAEAVQHHPDILIRFSKVTLTLSTHDAGGLSQRDVDFARDSDRLYAG